MPARIYHAVPSPLWRACDGLKEYRPPTYQADGFIHATHEPELLVSVLNQFCKEIPGDFLCLEIDTTTLQSKVIMEGPADVGDKSANGDLPAQLFPHVYGPLKPLQCVVAEHKLVRAADGTFLRVETPQQQPKEKGLMR